ncbi:unnamed protein product [Paramecium octaurelia]|uniref:WD40-repeat-containing domain n=1 Tax=Paramecium octaurelia TaxID=43137 RepID=A0A8S1XQI9_PAROT|nr:unnamed protein product [Paramecium octaurelia]
MKLKKQSSQKETSKKDQKKMRRGFKACKSCGFELHIHQKICKNCNHENTFVNKISFTQSKNNTIDFFKKITENQTKENVEKKIKKVPQKLMTRIHVFKKSFLYNNESNLDENLIKSISNNSAKQDSIDLIQRNEFKLNKKEILVDSLPVESGQFHKLEKGYLLYFGCSLLNIAINKGVILVSIQMNQYDNQQFSQLHLYGKTYEGDGVLGIIQQQKIRYMHHNEGAITQIKFYPQSITTIGTINAKGSFTMLSLVNTISDKLKILCKIDIPNQILNCFDWCPCKEQKISIGDQQGNIYIIEIKGEDFVIVNFLESYHMGIIKDLQFYIHNDNNSPLLLSGGYDGNLKIINPSNSQEIFNRHITSKGISQVKWDRGGKFILCINDDPNQKALMFCFFSIIKKDSIQVLQNVEKRLIQPLTGDDETQSCAYNPFHHKIYFASQNGTIYGADIEQIRKQAIKKEKKQTYQSAVVHFGQVLLENNTISYITSKTSGSYKKSIQYYDWSQGYHFLDVDESGNLILGNILGVLIML